jgi:uracil-DNA glycosylase
MNQSPKPPDVKMEASWKAVLQTEFEKEYFRQLTTFVRKEYQTQTIYPPAKLIFHAFEKTPFEQVRVVILGQDPYHGAGQAHGLSFSVPEGVSIPPSLRNIFKEVQANFGGTLPKSGNLERWAEQGVLLLNAVLTVRAAKPASHQKKGWEVFTDAVIRALSEQKEGLVFMLWGKYAQDKGKIIDTKKHLVLKAPHPSPMAQGFLGCEHFKKANAYLAQKGEKEIVW